MASLGVCNPCKDLKAIRELMHGQCVSSNLAVHSGSLKRSRNSSMHKEIRVIHNWMAQREYHTWHKGCFAQSCLLMPCLLDHSRQVLLCSLCAPGRGSLRRLRWHRCCPSPAAGEEKLQPLLRCGNRLWWSSIIWFTNTTICTKIQHIKDGKRGGNSPFLMTVHMISATNE